MLKKIFIILSILVPLVLTAQVGKLVGTVVDQETGKPLEGANIWVPDTKIGAASDVNGNFFLPGLSPGKYTFKVSVLGYKTAVLEDVEITAWKTTTLDIKLDQTVLQSKEVIIQKSEEKK